MKKKMKIGENFSSGAEKVESLIKGETPQNLAATQSATSTGMPSAALQNTSAYRDVGSEAREKEDGIRLTPAQKEAQAARRRVQLAVAKKELQERKAAYKKEKAERAKTSFRRWKASYEEGVRRKEEDMRAKKSGEEPPKRAPGFGGWLAAVVTLGTTTLALITVLAVGAVTMMRERNAAAAAARGTLYEFVAVVEGMEENLDEARLVTGTPLQSQLLTSAVVQARMAEGDLEKMPFSAEADKNLTTYLNKTAFCLEGMLAKLRAGGSLSTFDKRVLDELHDVSEKMTERLAEMMEEMEDKDMIALLKGKECCIGKAMRDIESITLPNLPSNKRIPPRSKESPSMQGKGESTLTSNQAKTLCERYFADYGVKNVVCDGETVSRVMCTYNFTMEDENGVQIFAQIDEKDGALVAFDYYEECTKNILDEESCLKKAQSFLEKIGLFDMKAIDVQREGTNLDIRFALQIEDVVHYGKEVTVKVCRERGKVVGYNGEKYLENKDVPTDFNAKITLQEAQDALSEKLVVEASRAVVFPYRGKTYSAYEFFVSADGEYYFLYTDATTGSQLFIKRA